MSAVRDARRGHFWMHDAIMDEYASELGVYGLAVYAMLCRRANKDGASHPSIRRIAEDLDISERQAKRELKGLKDLGLISIEQRSEQNKTSVYTVLEVPEGDTRPRVSVAPGDSEARGPVTVSHPKEYTKEGSVEANASSGIGKRPDSVDHVIGLEKHVTDKLYAAMDRAGYTLDNSEFGYHLGRAKKMLEKMAPTDAELEALPASAVSHFEVYAKTDAMSALRYLRQQKARKKRLSEGNEPPQQERQPNKPRPAVWYASLYPVEFDAVQKWIAEGCGHAEIERRIHAGEVA